jgi:serine/threonine protein kinase
VNDERELLRISFQIIEGIHYLHANNVIHWNIKPENIFKCKDDTIKIDDFGLVRIISKAINLKSTFAGNPAFMAQK